MTTDLIIAQLWTRGVCAGDCERLAELPADRADLAVFAALAALLADRTPTAPHIAPDAAAPVQALGHLVVAWCALRQRQGPAAAAALVAVDAALAASADDVRLPAVQAWADLVLAETAEVLGDRAARARRLDAIALAARAPAGLRVAAAIRRARDADLAADASLVDTLDAAARAARAADAPATAAEAALHAGLLLAARDPHAAIGRLASAAQDGAGAVALLARLLLAQTTHRTAQLGGAADAEDPQAILAAGLRRAAAEGDHLAYVAFTLHGARRYVQTGRADDAVLTLTAAIAQLERAGVGELASPLRAARVRLRRRLGPDAYARAERAALSRSS